MNSKHLQMIKDMILMKESEYKFVYNALISKAPCNMLVYGVGFDSKLWIDVNKGGRTVFLEDNQKYIDIMQADVRKAGHSLEVIKMDYQTVLFNAIEYLTDYEKDNSFFDLDLPPGIMDISWDIILIDGPKGGSLNKTKFDYTIPGRMKPIAFSSKLATRSKGTTIVLIHDINRLVEKVYCNKFFGLDYKTFKRIRRYDVG